MHDNGEMPLTAKPKKTKRELEALIMDRCAAFPVQFIQVFQSPVFGWDANLITAPHLVTGLRPQFEEIVREIREKFDLKL